MHDWGGSATCSYTHFGNNLDHTKSHTTPTLNEPPKKLQHSTNPNTKIKPRENMMHDEADDGMQHSDSIPQLGGMIVTHAVDEYDEEWIWGMRWRCHGDEWWWWGWGRLMMIMTMRKMARSDDEWMMSGWWAERSGWWTERSGWWAESRADGELKTCSYTHFGNNLDHTKFPTTTIRKPLMMMIRKMMKPALPPNSLPGWAGECPASARNRFSPRYTTAEGSKAYSASTRTDGGGAYRWSDAEGELGRAACSDQSEKGWPRCKRPSRPDHTHRDAQESPGGV
jgi:hypothetical protein